MVSNWRHEHYVELYRKLAKICQDSWNQWKDTGIQEILSQTDNHQHTEAKRPSALTRIYNDPQMD